MRGARSVGADLSEAEGDLLWQFRFSLVDDGAALPKFLLCVDWSSASETAQATEA